MRPPQSAGAAVGEVSGPESELQKLKAERDTLLDRLARLQAEFENARKRAAREQQEFRDYAAADAIKALLPVLDSFERALQVEIGSRSNFVAASNSSTSSCRMRWRNWECSPFPAKGEPFDPHVHEAIEMVETADAADHQVLEELQRGYKMKDRLLRPAMVRVAKNPEVTRIAEGPSSSDCSVPE